jgi:response regulator RpfG family c-di-GMP phosphodiesterase
MIVVEPDTSSTPAPQAGTRTARILCVDDEPAILNALRRTLTRDGYEVLRASSAVEALAILERERGVDVVLSDQQMPGMTGIAMMESVRRSFPDTIRLLVSAQCDIQAASDAINDGLISRFVLKPWRDDELETVLTLALRDGRLLQQTRAALVEATRIEAAAGSSELRRLVSSLKRLLEEHERRMAWGA